MFITQSVSDYLGIEINRYDNGNFAIDFRNGKGAITTIVFTGREFHELVFQCLRAQEREILDLIKLTEKNLEEAKDINELWNS